MTPTATPVTYGRDASIARFSVARYQKMIEVGILTSKDKVELLENSVVLEMPRDPPQPSGPTAVPAYGAYQTYQPGDDIPLLLDGAAVAAIAVADLLP